MIAPRKIKFEAKKKRNENYEFCIFLKGNADEKEFSKKVKSKIFENISSLEGMVHGFDFAKVINMYYEAYEESDDEKKSKVLKWFRGEYSTKTEAKNELGINIIITDDNWYAYVKLFAIFLVNAGYKGMLMLIDELVNLYRIPTSVTRQYNYEKILTMYNDTLQGKAKYLGIIMCGTPQCIEDTRRGLFSYEALRSRISYGKLNQEEYKDMLAPIIQLNPLTYEEMLILIEKVADIHATLFDYTPKLTQEDFISFIQIEYGRVGASTHLTPREVIRDFIELLNILYQNPSLTMKKVFDSKQFEFSSYGDDDEENLFTELEI